MRGHVFIALGDLSLKKVFIRQNRGEVPIPPIASLTSAVEKRHSINRSN